MNKVLQRVFAWLLLLAMTVSLVPVAQQASATELTQGAYADADDVFAQIDAMEAQPAKKNATQTQKTDAAAAVVMASDSYVEGSLERKGDSFTWWTDDGIRCVYSPKMRSIQKNMTSDAPAQDAIVNEPVATKGGSATGNQVYLVAPYYGYDDSFSDQYKKEAKRAAAAIGDTDGYTLYSGKSATVDKVATAVSNGAVVFFDSHGITDYESGNDFVSGATSSYLCLTSTTGLTDADYDDGALYYSDGICINGATIANHMTKNSPGGLLWMALCLGMATDTMCEPLRQMGVEVVYGYSQSVTFDGDYLFEETFWEEMYKGNTVAASIATMKATWGNWDWSTKIAKYYGYYDGYSTISAARRDYAAFPVVVSDEDAHPGQRYKNTFYGACSLQDVQSAYQLNVVADAPDTPDVGTDDTISYVDAPVAGTAYKLVMDQGNTGGQLGFTGAMNGYYYATSEAVDEMVDVYLETVAGGYRLYFMDGGVKTYLNVIPRDNDATKTNVVLQTMTENATPSVWVLNTQYKYMKTAAVGDEWYLGTYSTHQNISASKTSYIADTSTIGVSQFPAWFATVGQEQTPEVPEEPEVPETPADPEVTSATYIFEDYQISGEVGGMEANRVLDGTVTVTISSGWFTTEARIYSGANMVIESARAMDAIVLNAGYKTSTFDVYVSKDGNTWTLHEGDVSYVSSYSDITIDLPEGCRYVMLDAYNAQIRLKTMTVYFEADGTEIPDEAVTGDLDGVAGVNEDDAIYLLQYVLMPQLFPVEQSVDFNADGQINEDDAIYLLQHVLMPGLFPLN